MCNEPVAVIMQVCSHIRVKVGFSSLHPVCYDARPSKVGDDVLFMPLILGEDLGAIFFLECSANRIIVQRYGSIITGSRAASNTERAPDPVCVLVPPSVEDIVLGYGAVETPAVSLDQGEMLGPRIVLDFCEKIGCVHQDKYTTSCDE